MLRTSRPTTGRKLNKLSRNFKICSFSYPLIPIFFFFFQLYNSLWVLASSIISFHFFLSYVVCFQLFTPIFLKSFLTSSSHLTLGLLFGLVAYGFHLYMVLATLSLVILSTCPNQPSRLYFIYLTILVHESIPTNHAQSHLDHVINRRPLWTSSTMSKKRYWV